jgi:hypothetical protein
VSFHASLAEREWCVRVQFMALDAIFDNQLHRERGRQSFGPRRTPSRGIHKLPLEGSVTGPWRRWSARLSEEQEGSVRFRRGPPGTSRSASRRAVAFGGTRAPGVRTREHPWEHRSPALSSPAAEARRGITRRRSAVSDLLDSPPIGAAPLTEVRIITGPWSIGRTPEWLAGKEGSIPSGSTLHTSIAGLRTPSDFAS